MKRSLISEKISHYLILNKLGAGGMGEVYLAQDTRLDRKVAIKVLLLDSVVDERASKRLIREAQAAAKLDHPNICAVHEVVEEDERNFIIMQYVEGETLASRIQRKPLKLREALDLVVQVADALAEAHLRGVIHRDIKPQNIMVTKRGQVKVLDFGLAKFVQERSLANSSAETESLLTRPGTIEGTVPYMSPEQVQGESLDARTDIFSLGVVLYEMASGCRPFASGSTAGTISAILTKEPSRLARYISEVPAELERIVSKALRKDRDERYQTVKDLLIDLKNLRDELVFEAKLEHTALPESTNRIGLETGGDSTEAIALPVPAQSDNLSAARTLPSARRIASEIKRHKPTTAMIVATMIVSALTAASAVSYFYFFAPNSGAAIDSIAVLPFMNSSGSADAEYLSDGMTESLINSLSQIPNLSVKAHSTVSRYKGKEVDPQQVASELSVQAILSGRVGQRGNDLALYLSLVDAETGNQLWGEQYNRKLVNLVSLQSEIARDVSQKLRARLSGTDEQKVAKSYTENMEAYQLLGEKDKAFTLLNEAYDNREFFMNLLKDELFSKVKNLTPSGRNLEEAEPRELFALNVISNLEKYEILEGYISGKKATLNLKASFDSGRGVKTWVGKVNLILENSQWRILRVGMRMQEEVGGEMYW